MSAGVSSGGHGGRGGSSQDFELNLASIIDCFTVLIAFMLATASFLSIGILDAGVAAAGATASPGEAPPVHLTITLKKDHTITLGLSGKSNAQASVAAKGTEYDFDGMNEKLSGIKGQWTALTAATLVAENDVQYKDVIRSMEYTKKTLPAVLLGGF